MFCYGNDAEDSLQIYLPGIIFYIKINTLVNRLWNNQKNYKALINSEELDYSRVTLVNDAD